MIAQGGSWDVIIFLELCKYVCAITRNYAKLQDAKKINSTVICMNMPVRFNYYLTETEAAVTSFHVIHFNSSVIWSNIDFSTKVYLIALVVALHLGWVLFFLIMD